MSASGKAGHEFVPSAHFPRINKHDLEVVVEAMDKLREALRVEEADTAYTAPPSVDGLEAQCRDLIRENSTLSSQLGETPSQTFKRIGDKIAAFIRTRDRELVELAAKWDKENSLRSDDSYRYPQQLRAVLAARNEGGGK